MKTFTKFILLLVLSGCILSANASIVITRTSGKANWSDENTWLKYLEGEIRVESGSRFVNGIGTYFLRDLSAGEKIIISNAPAKITGIVKKINSDYSLELLEPIDFTLSGKYGVPAIPGKNDQVIIGNSFINANLDLIFDFPKSEIESLMFSSNNSSSSLIQSLGSILRIEKDVIFNQPATENQRNSWEINGATVYIDGSLYSNLSIVKGSQNIELIVNEGTLSINNDLIFSGNNQSSSQKFIIQDGIFNINGKFKMKSGILSSIGNSTLTFNSTFDFGGTELPQFRSGSQTKLHFGGDIEMRDLKSNLVLDANSHTSIKNHISIYTPAIQAILSFGNLEIGENASIKMDGNIWVSGNLISKGGNIYSGKNIVWLSGNKKKLGGTSTANLGNLSIYGGRTSLYTVVSDVSCNKLTFPSSISHSTINIEAGVTFTVLGDLTIQQPAVPAVSSLNIGNGVAQVSGDVTLGGRYQISSQISKISIVDGLLNVDGDLVMNSTSSTPQTAVFDMSNGEGIIKLRGQFVNSNNQGFNNTGIDEKRLQISNPGVPAL